MPTVTNLEVGINGIQNNTILDDPSLSSEISYPDECSPGLNPSNTLGPKQVLGNESEWSCSVHVPYLKSLNDAYLETPGSGAI